ncbi:MAG: hypothetical protein AB2776_10080 [Candidatus Thiodiazotropha endolucinida]
MATNVTNPPSPNSKPKSIEMTEISLSPDAVSFKIFTGKELVISLFGLAIWVLPRIYGHIKKATL